MSILILGCFFFSGMAGLVYEVLWVRLFDKVIGSAPFAIASVLTVFMAGLAGGSYFASKRVDRIEKPGNLLILYGALECAIGLYALILPFFPSAIKPLYKLLYNQIFDHFLLYNLISFFICCILLILPVAFMGATLPILIRFYVRQIDHLGRRAGQLYGINTAGAAVGTILAGFFLIQQFGVWGTIVIVAGVNFTVGFISMCLGRLNWEAISPTEKQRVAPSNEPGWRTRETPPFGHQLALILFAVSGFCAMGYQVIWSRLIGLLIAPTTYSFTLVVATFIIGLSLGNFIFGWIADRTDKTFHLLVATQIAAAFSALGVSHFLGNSQLFFSKIIYAFMGQFGQMMLWQFFLLFIILLGPTVLLGGAFPLVGKLYTTSIQKVGNSIGVAYAINTIGAILGSFAGGFILIPFLGKENGLTFIVSLQLAAGFFAWGTCLFRSPKSIRNVFALLMIMAIALFGVTRFPDWNRQLLSYGRYQNMDRLKYILNNTSWLEALTQGTRILQEKEKGREMVFYGDGVGGFTTVEKHHNLIGSTVYTLLNSGKPDATSHGDAATQALLAHIPLMFHPDAKDVMILGAGSGMTAGEALLYPIDTLDVLEINEQVIEASRFFDPWNNHYLEDPRTRIIVQDGRNHLSLWSSRYDVIISEPSNPWMAGMANLYTQEFFHTVANKLNRAGIFIQWVNTARMDWETMAMIGRTFSNVFKNSCLMQSPIGAGDYFFVGFKEAAEMSLDTVKARMRYIQNSKIMKYGDARLIYYLIVSEKLDKTFSDGQTHTDNWPRLEFAAPKDFLKSPVAIEGKLAEKRKFSQATRRILKTGRDLDVMLSYLDFSASLYTQNLIPIHTSFANQSQLTAYYRIISDYCSNKVVNDYNQFANDHAREICSDIQLKKMSDFLPLAVQKTEIYNKMGIIYGRKGKFDESMQAFNKSLELDDKNATTYYNLAMTMAIQGNWEESRSILAKAISNNPSFTEAYVLLAKVDIKLGNSSEAKKHLKRALEIEEDEEARRLIDTL